MSRNDLIGIYNVLTKIMGQLSESFSYLIYRNLELLQGEYDAIRMQERAVVPTERYLEFRNKREVVIKTFVMRNEKDELLVDGSNNFVFKSEIDRDKFHYNMKQLSVEYGEDIVMYDTSMNQLTEMKADIIDVKVLQVNHKVFDVSDIPHEIRKLFFKYFCSDVDSLDDLLFDGL